MIQVDGIFVQGGGFSASISVVTGASLPNTVTNGQIFVVTSTTPTNIYLDTNAPASPTSGDMWIEIASSDIGIVFSTIPFFRNGFYVISLRFINSFSKQRTHRRFKRLRYGD